MNIVCYSESGFKCNCGKLSMLFIGGFLNMCKDLMGVG